MSLSYSSRKNYYIIFILSFFIFSISRLQLSLSHLGLVGQHEDTILQEHRNDFADFFSQEKYFFIDFTYLAGLKHFNQQKRVSI